MDGSSTVIVTGPAGAGKTVVGRLLAEQQGWVFAEGDDFHSAHEVQKMTSGHPLTDQDRRPWLRRLADWVGEQEQAGRSAVLTCSALKRAYRTLLADGHPSVVFVQLDAERGVLAERIGRRSGHFMPASLLPSQLADLELLNSDEHGHRITADTTPDEVAARISAALGLRLPTARPTTNPPRVAR